jgi:NMD protein affecting ribosome stability and mRNA decay
MSLSYEQKMELLARVKPEYKDVLLLRLMKGERVDITKDEGLFYQINADRMSMEDFTNRDKFKHDAEAVKREKANILDTAHGVSRGKKMRWLGDIPAEIYFNRPEFSPLLPKAEREANIKKWFNMFPTFKAGDKKL